MSAVRDETSRAREAVAAADAIVATLSGQLAAVPGWLRVGDPDRHADPGDQAAAQAAVALAERLDRARRARGMLAERVEELLGDPPPSIRAWLAMTAWLEGLDGPDALLDGLEASAERWLTADATMPREKAESILAYIAANGGRVGDGYAFQQGVPLDAADLGDLRATGRRLRLGEVPAPGWDVLLPVRLETRFLPPGTQGPNEDTDDTQWRLLVRVEPDAPAVANRPAPVWRDEAALVATAWTECGGSLDGEPGATAFAKLAHRVGPARAAFLLRTVPVTREDAGFGAPDLPERPEKPSPEPPLIALPATIEIWGGPEDASELLATLHPDRETMAATATIEAVADPDEEGHAPGRRWQKGQTPRRWWNSYLAAQDVGLAVEIALGQDQPGFPVLFCLGYDEADEAIDPAELLSIHADAGRIGWLPPLAPTNTVAGAPSTDLGADPAQWLLAARGAPAAGGGAVMALAGASAIAGLPAPDRFRAELATVLVQALWPVLWQRSFKDVGGGGEEIWRLGEWAGRHLHAFGPLPVLRIGDLPYGLLPVGDGARWRWRHPDSHHPGDPSAEQLPLAALPLLIEPLQQLAADQGTAAGADAERLLEILEQVPTSGVWGTRQVPATVLFDALSAALGASDPGDRVQEWQAQFAWLRPEWPPGPARRYSPVLDVEPLPEKTDPEFGRLLRVFLDSPWYELADLADTDPHWWIDGLPPSVVARLVRHSLLLTQAEVTRLDIEAPPVAPGFLLPLNGAEIFGELARRGEHPVRDLPQWMLDRLDHPNVEPRTALVCRQFEDVRAAVERLTDAPPDEVARVLPAVLDLSHHRVDAWQTALASRRLGSLAAAGGRPRLGCYGWVDDLSPNPDPTPPTTAGLLHAPGYAQALTAAVLRDQAVHRAEEAQWDIALNSGRIRTAAGLAGQVRAGVHLSEALGREIERRAGAPERVLDLRKLFPARPEWEGRRVSDGQRVLNAAGCKAGFEGASCDGQAGADAARLPGWLDPDDLKDLWHALDAYADLIVCDALHDVAAGRAPAAAEALEAGAGLAAPPELRFLRTQRGGGTVRTSVAVALPWLEGWDDPEEMEGASPSAVADPALAGLLERETLPADQWTWTAGDGEVTLADLGLAVADATVLGAERLNALAGAVLGSLPDGGTAPAQCTRAAAICGALGSGMVPEDAAAALRARLARLRTLAADLAAALLLPGAQPAAGWPWGVVETDPQTTAEQLSARLADIGAPEADATAGAATLAERIRRLLPSALPLALACPAPRVPQERPLDEGWLEVVAAVRPALARLEVAQLTADEPWPATLGDDLPVWAPADTRDAHRTVQVTFRPEPPNEAEADREALVAIDGWAETIPSRLHSTWAAFGYDAPRARPQQAILLALPADMDAPDPPADVRGAILTARRLARLRGLRPPLSAEVGLILPTSMFLDDAVSPAGAALAGEA